MRYALRFLGNLLRICLWPLWLLARRSTRPRSRWVEVKLHPHPVEIDSTLSLLQRLLQQKPGGGHRLRSIAELRRLFRTVESDATIDGVLVHVPHLHCGFATCQSLRSALLGLRARGKRVVAYLPLGGGNRELLVCLAADRVFASPQASISLLGAASQAVYLKPLLDRAGIEPDVMARGEYKTAGETLLRDSMSEPQREQVGALLDVVQRELEQAVAQRPGLDADAARALFKRGIWGAQAARRAGVIDGCCYEDELPLQLGIADGGDAARPMRHARYLAHRRAVLWRPLRPPPQIAVVHVHGAITHMVPRVPTSRVAGLAAVTAALRRARRNPRVRAVLLHVDSPGGSALASDLIHREIVRLREKKPIVAYLGDVAASGGYYVAAPCRRIFAQPTTITGSIGVVSVRLIASALAERVGLRPQTVRSAPHADIMSPFRALEADERAMLAAETESIYQSFVGVVAVGRGRATEEIERVARGRVWAGADALRHGLVDEIGGVEQALSCLRELAPELRGLSEDAVDLAVVGPGRGFEPPPPAEPARASRWDRLLRAALPSELGEVLSLAGEGERVLYYSAIPELW